AEPPVHGRQPVALRGVYRHPGGRAGLDRPPRIRSGPREPGGSSPTLPGSPSPVDAKHRAASPGASRRSTSQAMSILIRDATVITVDDRRRIFEPGAVYVEGAHITDVGPSDEVVRRHPTATRVLDGRRKVVIPGFVSAHNHVGYTLF